ncbi:MAG: tetratricopeptide repeat protein, partial [Paracoccaceae bacterium]|nr:tetratricopeptide repeat protein [Paracoccaceae bacterium]
KAAQGAFGASAATVEEGLSAIPDASELLWAKASYLEQQGDIAGAIAVYGTLYARDSGSVIIANNLASLLISFSDDTESLARAETIARRLNGTDIPAFQDTYGYIQFRRGNLQEALAYLEPAAAGLPNDPVVQFHLGEVYAALDRPSEALGKLRVARDIAQSWGNQDLVVKIAEQINLIEALQEGEGQSINGLEAEKVK